jgi:hypothetical protein
VFVKLKKKAMIKKIIIWGLVLLAMYFFYKKFMADTLNPFFGRMQKDRGEVDFFQQKVADYEVKE